MGDAKTTRISSWGMALHAECDVRRPETLDGLRTIIAEAATSGRSVGFRGQGNSYGDASLNSGGIVVDCTGLRRIESWDPESGIVVAEPGVRLADVWRRTIEDGFWPPVVSGTMTTTLGGAAAMNIHGKNNFKLGTIGEHIEWFDLALPDGTETRCSPQANSDLFHAAIGGIGMLGAFTRIALRLKRVHSGLIAVIPHSVKSFTEGLELLESHKLDSDYLVGWHDGLAGGKSLGRGVIHRARHLHDGEDPDPKSTLQVARQSLPANFFGVIPKSWMWTGLWCFMNDPGMRLLNAGKYWSGIAHAKRGRYLQSHAGYHFLLDYVPNYKYAFKPGGMIQYQIFVPAAFAARVFNKCIETAQAHGLPPYLIVTKRHRPDPFLMTHSVDGFSMAMDYPVRSRSRRRLWTMLHAMDELILDAGGRFYFAKDSTLRPEIMRRCYPQEAVAAFLALKQRVDPRAILQTDLFRRVFSE